MTDDEALSQLYFKDTAFENLMQKRIFNVLLIASAYDAFMMEEDGRVEEQLYFEYTALNLSSPPRVTRALNSTEGIEIMKTKNFDLVIMMPGNDVSETFAGARRIRELYPEMPIIVLTPFSKEVSRRLSNEDFTGIDYVFSWLGNVDLLLAIIKLLEDKMNADNDINGVGVQMILLVEDSVRFYSSVLPIVYKFILKQSREFSTEALNEHEQMLRMRGRPKVMLARDYEEALELYDRYSDHILGVISDVSFMREGKKDPKAGIRLARELRERDPYLPLIIESSENENAHDVSEVGGTFIDKNSKKFPVDLGKAIINNFGFGDFVIRNPESGEEIFRIKSLKDLQKNIFDIPAEALYWHASFNDISRWLYSRAMFPIAEVIKHHRFRDLKDAPQVRKLFFDLIVKYRKMKNRGVVAIFQKERFDRYSNFARIGQGSLGGKGRGLAFIDSIIKKNPVCDNFDGISITIPRTVVLCTDIFDEFMESNKLYPIALSDAPDEEILDHFLKGKLPRRIKDDLLALFEVVDTPIAVRSSSLLEDSHYQPFAGIYSTYMVPKVSDPEEMLRMVTSAIKGVYASVFYSDSKAYMTATSNVIDQEKMAVILQEVVGREVEGYYFPSFSGVGRSLNYYPLNDEKPEDGVAEVAVGLGKYIVDGGLALRFSPRHPENVLQTSELSLALRDTQTRMYALDMKGDARETSISGQKIDKPASAPSLSVDDGYNVAKLRVQDVAEKGALKYMVSTFDFRDNVIRDSDFGEGRRVVTFNNVLKHKAYPLAESVDFMLTTGQEAMQRPVEIEFAGMIGPDPKMIGPGEKHKGRLYWLQIRPIVDRKETVDEALMATPDEKLLLKSGTALGHGNIEGVNTVVYVRPEKFSSSNNSLIAREIEKINRGFLDREERYILIGPGRWGSSDTSLGIPVKWPAISAARLIVESSLPNYRIEPSQGTHFFQNLTSFGVAYFTIDTNAHKKEGDPVTDLYDVEFLNSQPAVYESDFVRIVTFQTPLAIGVNGLKGTGVVVKPEV
ncbi:MULTISPECIES: PEP/pyruvate-binding domain-containing protein [Duncaniella]|uniref:Phosphoenolpyruvate synthase n=2 Tax=Duncaniella TaxID=2518495 RepID=A0A4P7W617_9BACT|nr:MULTISPECIES: PEP/pyruvate-binding domain-containing protein [Duncaniella]MBJ2189458.1 phosphoenolpyruvate synthase [Muribaculaceae bacterium]MCX4284605.1 phosphoenolpyruvate synthase [Duncaniella dubosii]QCD43473.1 phosphoenolpyruvate synthase [Duncaniella dubosii]